MLRNIKKACVFSLVLVMVLLVTVTISAAEYDFNGETVTIGGWIPFDDYEEGEYKEHLLEVEKEFNVNIELKHVANVWGDFLPSVLAGDPIVDVLETQMSWATYQFIPQNAVRPLDHVLDEEYFNSLPPSEKEIAKDYLKIKGKYYLFSAAGGHTFDRKLLGSTAYLVWNKDLFKEEGLTSLYDLYDEDNWTWDEMLKIVKKATKDTNSDDEIDQWGLGSWHPFVSYYFDRFLESNDGQYAENIDGKVTATLDQKESLETLNYLKELDGYMGGNVEDFLAGNCAIMITPHAGLERISEQMSDDYGIMYMPKGPQREKNVVSVTEGVSVFLLPISQDNEAPLIELTNALFKQTDKYQDMDKLIDELVNEQSMKLRDRESVRILRDMYYNIAAPDKYSVGGWVAETQMKKGDVIKSVINGEKSAAAAMIEYKPVLQAGLDQLFND